MEDPTQPVEIVLRRAGRIRFALVDEDGRPVNADRPGLFIAPTTDNRIHARGDHYQSSALPDGASRGRLIVSGYEPRDLSWDPRPGLQDLGRVTLTRGVSVHVVVRDAGGDPVRDARITAARPSGVTGSRFFAGRLNTDDDGEVAIGGLPPEPLQLRVSHPRFVRFSVTLPGARQTDYTETVVLSRGATVRLTATNPDGQPLSRVKAGVTHSRGISREDGHIELRRFPVGEPLSLRLSAPNYFPRVIAVPPLAEGQVIDLGEISMTTGISVRGRVVDDRGHGVPGAHVSLARVAGAYTDPNGVFELRGVPDGSHTVTCKAARHGKPSRYGQPGSSTQQLTTVTGMVSEVELQLARTSVHQRVVRFDDGTPIPQISVRIEQGEFRLTVMTDESGVFALPDIQLGEFSLSIDVKEWLRLRSPKHSRLQLRSREEWAHLQLRMMLDSPEEIPDVLEIQRGATLRVVVSSETPAELPATILLMPTDKHPGLSSYLFEAPVENGVAVLEHLAEGKLAFAIAARGFHSGEPLAVDLTSGVETVVEIQLRPLESREVQFTAVAPDGSPVAGARVFLYGGALGTTDASGRVSLPLDWSPLGFWVNASGFVPYRRIGAEHLVGSPIRVQLDRGVTLEVRLRNEDGTPHAPGKRVTGDAVLRDFPRIPHHERCGSFVPMRNLTFDDNGLARIDVLERAPQRISVRVRGHGGRFRSEVDLSGSASARELEIVVPPPRTMQVRVSIDGEVRELRVSFHFAEYYRSATSRADGTLDIDLYGTGRCKVLANTGKPRTGWYEREVVITKSGELVLDFTAADFVEQQQ